MNPGRPSNSDASSSRVLTDREIAISEGIFLDEVQFELAYINARQSNSSTLDQLPHVNLIRNSDELEIAGLDMRIEIALNGTEQTHRRTIARPFVVECNLFFQRMLKPCWPV